MQQVEQHVIDKKDTRYGVIDAAAYASENLYNAALYEIRQAFIMHGKYLNYRAKGDRGWCGTLPGSPSTVRIVIPRTNPNPTALPGTVRIC